SPPRSIKSEHSAQRLAKRLVERPTDRDAADFDLAAGINVEEDVEELDDIQRVVFGDEQDAHFRWSCWCNRAAIPRSYFSQRKRRPFAFDQSWKFLVSADESHRLAPRAVQRMGGFDLALCGPRLGHDAHSIHLLRQLAKQGHSNRP